MKAARFFALNEKVTVSIRTVAYCLRCSVKPSSSFPYRITQTVPETTDVLGGFFKQRDITANTELLPRLVFFKAGAFI